MRIMGHGDCCGGRILDNMDIQRTVYDPQTGRYNRTTPSVAEIKELIDRNPGVTTCLITGSQRRRWHTHLIEAGFQLVADNIINSNTGRILNLYVFIANARRGYGRQTPGSPAKVPLMYKPRQKQQIEA